MKTSYCQLAAAVAVLFTGCQQAAGPFLPEHDAIDVLIENGRVIDGSGAEPVSADVVIVGDTIVFVGDASFTDDDRNVRIAKTIDADGRVVTPGFIDLHAHGDPLETPAMENFLAMGATTIALGQDGSSPDVQPLSDWLADVSATGIGTNLAMFVGHGTLRNQSGIGMSAEPEPEDTARMLAMLDETLDYTFGLSTGLEYNPGLNADTAELRALAKVVGANDRLIMSHMRNEDDDQLESSIAELLEQGEDARVHIAHLKSVYGQGAARAGEILGILDDARANGIDITAEIYPYSASYTGIAILFPVWAKTQEQFDVAKVERRQELADYLRDRVNRRNGPEATLLGSEPWTGRTLADLAHEMEMPFEDVLIDVIGPKGAYGAYFVMNDELQARLLQDPQIGVCSDGSPTGFHPRGHGTFAKIIETYVNERQVLSLPEAIRKMTSFAAGVIGIRDRGTITPGMKADILVFDPAAVHATATYPEPLQLADGFDIVIVNGQVARESGTTSDALHGRVLQPE
jgi:N-acyl-D-amino-acid deacylase